jgi:murein DD-endopeptidase MepM/ murein hydrolase activator NlpD
MVNKIKSAGFLFALFLSTACSHFHGPGNLQTPEYVGPTEYQGQGSGKHEYSKEDVVGIAFDWPVDDARLTQAFDASKKRPHWGIDIANQKGTPILASERGYVIYTGRQFHGYGNLIVIEHSTEWATLYAHLSSIDVKEGQFVKQGEPIGKMGRTGRATGVHLHFEIRHNRQPVNPQAYLPAGATPQAGSNDASD